MPPLASALDPRWFQHWQAGGLLALLASSLLQWALSARDAERGRLLRNNLLFGLLCLAGSLGGQALERAGVLQAARLCDALATLGLGLLLIRIGALTLMRALLPLLRLQLPRIMQDLLLALAYLVWALVWLRRAGLDLNGLVATSAVITAVLAFSLQDTLGNILGGLALQLDNSVRLGDWIRLDELRGQVVEVRWRHTAVRSNDGHVFIIPNSLLMKSKVDVYARSHAGASRRWVRFSVGDQIPPQAVIAAAETALRQAQIEHQQPDKAADCVVTDSRDGAIHYALRYWLAHPAHDDRTDSQVRLHLFSALQRQGFWLARPTLDVRTQAVSDTQDAARQQAEMAQRLAVLRQCRLFAALTEAELQQLAQALHPAPFMRGELITRQGAEAHWLYLLADGEVAVWDEPPGQPRRALGQLQAPAVFGEIGLLTGAPRAATITAHSDARCLRLDKAHFEQILHARPALAEEFAARLVERSSSLELARSTAASHEAPQQARYLNSIRRFFGLA